MPTKLPAAHTKLLSQIQTLLTTYDLSDIELTNLKTDLNAWLLRVKNHQYQYTTFLDYNVFDFPRRNQEFLQYTQRWLDQANAWKEIITKLNVPPTGTIIDLLPGSLPKIELALNQLRFQGTIHAIDLDPQALKALDTHLSLISPLSFIYVPHHTNLYQISNIKADLIIANHIIDDLLLYEFSESVSQPLSKIYDSEKAFLEAISHITKNPPHPDDLSQKISTQLFKLSSSNCIIALNNYKGIIETGYQLDEWYQLCTSTLTRISNTLLEHGFIQVQLSKPTHHFDQLFILKNANHQSK